MDLFPSDAKIQRNMAEKLFSSLFFFIFTSIHWFEITESSINVYI